MPRQEAQPGFRRSDDPHRQGLSTEKSIEITSLGVQIHGGMGFIETGAASISAISRITGHHEGTTGIQAADLIGRKIAREGGETIKAVIATMREVLPQLDAAGGPAFAAIRNSFAQGVDARAGWSSSCAPTQRTSERRWVPAFLELFGVVAGGWQMAYALVAQIAARRGCATNAFHRTKIVTSRSTPTTSCSVRRQPRSRRGQRARRRAGDRGRGLLIPVPPARGRIDRPCAPWRDPFPAAVIVCLTEEPTACSSRHWRGKHPQFVGISTVSPCGRRGRKAQLQAFPPSPARKIDGDPSVTRTGFRSSGFSGRAGGDRREALIKRAAVVKSGSAYHRSVKRHRCLCAAVTWVRWSRRRVEKERDASCAGRS